MLITKKTLRWILMAAMTGTGVVACGGTPSKAPSSAVTTGVVFHAMASSLSTQKYGITRWHGIIEQPSHAVVIDGVDAKGNVLFLTAIRFSDSDHTMHIENYGQDKGAMIVDYKTGQLLSNTLSHDTWSPMASAFSSDWAAYPQVVPYGFWGYVGSGLAIVGGAAAIVGGVIAEPFTAGASTAAVVGGYIAITGGVATIAGGVAGAVETYNSDQSSAQQTQQLQQLQGQVDQLQQQQQQTQQQLQQIQQNQQNNQPQDNQTPQDPSQGQQNSASQDQSSDTSSSSSSTSDPSQDPSQGTNLPADSSGNLDDSATNGVGDTGGGGDFGDDDSSGGGGDFGDDDSSGGGGDFGDDSGGDDSGGDFAAGVCRKVLVSKTTLVRGCVHY